VGGLERSRDGAFPTCRDQGVTRMPRSTPRWLRPFVQGQEAAIVLIAVALAIYFSLSSPDFATSLNAATLSQYTAPIAFFAIAEVFILILGEIDLSVGEVYVLTPFVVVMLANRGVSVIIGVIVSLLISCGIGLINGLVVVKLRVPSFITTLGTSFALAGIILIGSNGTQTTPAGQGEFTSIMGGATWSEIIWAVALATVLHLVLRRTAFGMHTVAVGGNEDAARESGIRADTVKICCFVMCSLVGGLIGILDGYNIGSLDPATDGLTLMFYGVAAAVLGGTLLTGGRGTIIGAFIGSAVLGILEDGFHILGVNAFAYQMVLGLTITVAMILNVQLDLVRSGRRKRGSFARALTRVWAPVWKSAGS
jgi:simple sugar transport system permease protein